MCVCVFVLCTSVCGDENERVLLKSENYERTDGGGGIISHEGHT